MKPEIDRRPKVSVVIPTYNRREDLERAIQSVQAQTLQDIEIMVVDNGSTDGTLAMLKEMKKSDPRISFIRNHGINNASAGRNVGIYTTRGKYIAFLDSDDLWHPEKLQKQYELLEKDPDPNAICICHYNDVLKTGGRDHEDFTPLPETNFKEEILAGLVFNMGSVMMAPRRLLENGELNFDETLDSAEDWEWLLRFALKGGTIKVVPEKLSTYRREAKKIYPHQVEISRYIHKKLAATVRSQGRRESRLFSAGVYSHMMFEARTKGGPAKIAAMVGIMARSPTSAAILTAKAIRRRIKRAAGKSTGLSL